MCHAWSCLCRFVWCITFASSFQTPRRCLPASSWRFARDGPGRFLFVCRTADRKRAPPKHKIKARRSVILRDAWVIIHSLGAGPSAVVDVGVGTGVVAVQIAQPSVGRVVVVAAAPGDAPPAAPPRGTHQLTARSPYAQASPEGRGAVFSFSFFASALSFQPHIRAPISSIFCAHTPKLWTSIRWRTCFFLST